MKNNNLLTLFTWTGLLSSTGSTAAALTLNRTPMRATNTTKSCMLWQECRWPTGATVTGVCVCVCVCPGEQGSEQPRPARDPEVEKVQCSWRRAASHKIWKPLMFLLLSLQSPSLFYTPLPLSATDVDGGGCMTEGWRVYVCEPFGWGCTWVWKRRGRWRGQERTNGTSEQLTSLTNCVLVVFMWFTEWTSAAETSLG